MIRDEIIELLDLLQKHNVTEKNQKELLLEGGLYFDYTWGDPDYNHENRRLDLFEVKILIELLDNAHIQADINEMIRMPHMFKYPELVRMIADNNGDGEIVFVKIKKEKKKK